MIHPHSSWFINTDLVYRQSYPKKPFGLVSCGGDGSQALTDDSITRYGHMNTRTLANALALFCIGSLAQSATPAEMRGPLYDKDQLVLPANYREWIYLSTGFDMSYSAAASPGHHMFDNVFVEPFAYKFFLETGTWPDKTVLVLEVRGARGKGSINQHGNYQDEAVMGLKAHVKDAARFEGGWAFFEFDGHSNGRLVPHTEDCYSCHASHAAVDSTFVQFYPTLLPLARSKGTLSSGPDY